MMWDSISGMFERIAPGMSIEIIADDETFVGVLQRKELIISTGEMTVTILCQLTETDSCEMEIVINSSIKSITIQPDIEIVAGPVQLPLTFEGEQFLLPF